jgi:hypothetical protein
MAACTICAYADAHGWWGPSVKGGTHCRTCHASWTGSARAHCTVCHETFSTNGVADVHWRRNVHHDPRSVSALRQGDDGTWHTVGEAPAHWGKAAAA